ncbi:WD repeat-containing protein 3 [Nymphon striatum]|nr:WD repeat-containing protein 3 [Nymphon striatum]
MKFHSPAKEINRPVPSDEPYVSTLGKRLNMGITKQYLRTVPGPVFGIIGSSNGTAQFVNLRGSNYRYAVVTACENVILWDTKTGEKVFTMFGDKQEATIVQKSPDKEHIAVGYKNGSIKIFSLFTSECVVTFSGHRSSVTCLRYDVKGMLLASGSKDTEIVIWDVVTEAGMFRLRGHKGGITQLYFAPNRNYLISSSKDTFLKFWDLDTQHCFKTMTGHHSEIWDFVLMNDGKRLMTGTADSEIRAWDLIYKDQAEIKLNKDSDEEEEKSDEDDVIKSVKVGSIMRSGKGRILGMSLDQSGRVLACHGNEGFLEVFLMMKEEEIEKKMKKRKKKLKKSNTENDSEPLKATFRDEIKRMPVLKTNGKIKYVHVFNEKDSLKILLLLHNNLLEVHSMDTNNEKNEANCLFSMNQAGHRTDVRSMSFSSDGTAILTASGETVKIWSKSSQHCIKTMPCEYALCSAFLPGDRHCIVGTRSGKLQIFDIPGRQLLEDIEAHQGTVASLSLSKDQRGFVTGGSDKEVKFWEFELITDENFSETCKRITAIHTRSLTVDEEVLCVKLSHDGKLIAVSLQNSKVLLFFTDSFKFFGSLYGHKFPVLNMDISEDNTLIATGSADKHLNIWSLYHCDCNKSIFAHDDNITSVQFIPKTHYVVTGSKDGVVKQWDADNFQKIISLTGHHESVWAVAVSPDGQYIASASHDKSLRLWNKTDEPLILQEEQQIEREEMDEQSAIHDQTMIPGETDPETGRAAKKTIQTVKSAEKLMEALDISKLPKPEEHLLMVAYKTTDPNKFVLETLKKIKSSELEEALLVLPFSYVMNFMKMLNTFLNNSWEVELALKCILFLLRINANLIMSNSSLLPMIDNLRKLSQQRVDEMKDLIGFNCAGLKHMKRKIEENEDVQLFIDATNFLKKKKKKRKVTSAIIST